LRANHTPDPQNQEKTRFWQVKMHLPYSYALLELSKIAYEAKSEGYRYLFGMPDSKFATAMKRCEHIKHPIIVTPLPCRDRRIPQRFDKQITIIPCREGAGTIHIIVGSFLFFAA
jgi:hypothetical protein